MYINIYIFFLPEIMLSLELNCMNIAVTENVSIVTTYRVPFKDFRDT